MIFASDLDRTLIYSSKFTGDYPAPVKAVETGDYYSYMTAAAAELLKDLAGKVLFVPCTTRTMEQYRRIGFLQKEVPCRYAVTSNGANILVNGVPDTAYRAGIMRDMAGDCAAGPDILKVFGRLSGAGFWSAPMRHADEAFYYCIVERDKVPLQELADFSNWAGKQNWHVSLQGRKLYLVPRVVNKWSALQRVVRMAGDHRVVAAGDSLLDLPLVQGADYAISPAHGELFEQYSGSHLCACNDGQSNPKHGLYQQAQWVFTKSSGIAAGEEIIRTVLQLAHGFLWRKSRHVNLFESDKGFCRDT
ncbi:hypothetical protein [Desulfallas thermosapovorans]|uniref:Hydroxymethylpyrimidine pyrophosphatase-like HAD family hydrolase n=1 Tax=Desulfallas thermosapovorans DSM 6562 TaxID=1121431 RepID=A0A5S4ZQY7_9FIRM|nr:hypothetical protein [Desulfallas thermosapovorans]TYO95305.1 hypothetical protein LX24_01655 [Desulfallas thermosapovorans DSM 6562]